MYKANATIPQLSTYNSTFSSIALYTVITALDGKRGRPLSD